MQLFYVCAAVGNKNVIPSIIYGITDINDVSGVGTTLVFRRLVAMTILSSYSWTMPNTAGIYNTYDVSEVDCTDVFM